MANVTANGTLGRIGAQYNYPALLLGVPLILVIILGNVLVCLSVLTERSLKTATNYFIVSLAVADLLLAVLVLPLYVYSEFLGGIWTLDTHICDALMTMDVMLCTASILNLCAISVDSRESNLLRAERRFSLGLRHERNTGAGYLVPGLSPTDACPGPVPDGDLITAQGDSASDAEGGGERAREGSPRANGARGRRNGRVSNSKSSRVSGRERKAMKVLPVVVGVFLACWTPFFVVHVTKVLCVSCDIKPPLISVVTWLGYVNSAVNPIIYTAFNTEFKNVFQKLLCCQT